MNHPDSKRRLYKSRTDRMLDGVCGGIAEFFNLDSTLVRIAWVLLTLLGGSGIILYVLAMIIMPKNPEQVAGPTPRERSSSNHKFWGILLVIVGTVWLGSNLGFIPWFHIWHVDWESALAVLLILLGVAFLMGGRNYVSDHGPEEQSAEGAQQSRRVERAVSRLYRSRTDRKLFGVCGGLGMYFSIDPTIVRLFVVVSALASFGITLLAYIIMAIVVPEEPLAAHPG